MIITRGEHGAHIRSYLIASGADMNCSMEENTGGDGSASFRLKIEEKGQVMKGCDLEMIGEFERDELIPFFEQIVYELKLLQKNGRYI